MDRKSLIYCLSALTAMIVTIVAGTALLYRKDSPVHKSIEERYGLAYAVPANAVAVFFLSQASDIDAPVFSSFDFPERLADYLDQQNDFMAGNRMAVSLHYAGSLAPLYVFDAGVCSDEPSESAQDLLRFVQENGLCAEYVNCSKIAPESPLASHSVIIAAKTKAQINVSKNQLVAGESFMKASGFMDAAADAPEDALFISYDHARVLFEKSASRNFFKNRYESESSSQYSSMAAFFSTFSQWCVVDLTYPHAFGIVQEFSTSSDYMAVLDHASPSVSTVSEVLPYSTRFVLTLPMGSSATYLAAYSDYLESVQKSGVADQKKEELRKNTKVKPADFVNKLKVTEVATASFSAAGGLERVNLLKLDRLDTLLLRGTGEADFTAAYDAALPYAFPEYIASVFGPFFSIADESHFTLMDNWLITGSLEGVSEYASGRALSYDLKTYMSDAGQGDLLADRVCSCVAYLDIPEGDKDFADVIKADLQNVHDSLKGNSDYAPIVMSVYKKDGSMHTDINVHQLDMRRLRPEKFMKEFSVEVPEGPFPVINPATGRNSFFYQQANGAIALKGEDGIGIWGVPFKKDLCGTAYNVDCYNNGNIQILFGAGSCIYLMDKRTAFVSGYPKDLGKDILVGPDVYDVDGDKQYILMVLHKDNTIEMYDLKGQKPEAWKGIVCKDPIRGLPERLQVGDRNFWVVRTAVQVLVYPFDGGEPLNTYTGDYMIVPNAEITVEDSERISAMCYDGNVRSLKL